MEEFLLTFFIFVDELDEEIDGSGFEDFLVSLEIIKAEFGAVGDLL